MHTGRAIRKPTLPQRIYSYLASQPDRTAHYRTMAQRLRCEGRTVANACHRLYNTGRLERVWEGPGGWQPGVYRLPRRSAP